MPEHNTNPLTKNNVTGILGAIGCIPDFQEVSQGWTRVFIHEPQEKGLNVTRAGMRGYPALLLLSKAAGVRYENRIF
ncbi:MAG: hypothetical protein JRD89_01650 [Deltaproteobacteria bacterium]|nr:hypothetical protein [Deltaproteobacteria bacterium]